MRDGTLLADYMMPFRLDYVPSEDVRALFKNRRPSGEADFRD